MVLKDDFTQELIVLNSELEQIITTLNQYKPTEVFDILNTLIINNTLSYIIDNKNPVSPRLSINLFYLYKRNIQIGQKRIKNKDLLLKFLIDKLNNIYSYYTDTLLEQSHELNLDLNFSHFYGINFNSYHFDYPNIVTSQYLKCFSMNKDLLENYLKQFGLTYYDLIKGWLICTFYELIGYHFEWKNHKFNGICTSFSEKKLKKTLTKHNVNSINFLNIFFPLLDNKPLLNDSYPTDDFYNETFCLGLRKDGRVFFPRSVYQFNDFWKVFINSKEMITNKGHFLEQYTHELLIELFGTENVFWNIYDENGHEQDFIVRFEDYILCFECKAETLKEPFRNLEKAEKRMHQNFNSSIKKAYTQGLRVKSNLLNNSTKFYDSDSIKNRKIVLDIENFDSNNFIIIVVTLENYLNLSSKLTKYLSPSSESYPWVIDIFSLEHIINKLNFDSKQPRYLINYIIKRIVTYDFIQPMGADELECFGFYLKYENFPELSKSNSTLVLGNNYTSFVLDYLYLEPDLILHYLKNLTP